MFSADQRATVAIGDLPVAAAVIADDGSIVVANAELRRLVGETDGRSACDLVVRSARDELASLLRAGGSDGAHHAPTLLRLDPCVGNGHVAEFRATRSADGCSTVVFVVPRHHELAVIEDLASRAHDLHGQGVVIGDGARIVHVSDAAAEIYGRSSDELMARGNLFGLFEADEQRRIRELVARCVEAGEPIPEHFETVIERPDGSLVPVELWVKAVIDGDSTRTYTLLSDATERREHAVRLAHMATHDPLTGLANRHLLLDRLGSLLNRVQRTSVVGVLCFIDLDRFKDVNDTYGHAVGDDVLRTIAARLSQDLRPSDTAARLGGDEFVVLYDVVCDRGHGPIAERLRTLIHEPVVTDDWTVQVDASVGTVTVDDPDADPGALLDLADRRMYEQKARRLRADAP